MVCVNVVFYLVFLALPVALHTAAVASLSCSPSQFPCGDGGCVSAELVCDGSRDCADGSDELGCGRQLVRSRQDSTVLQRTRRDVSKFGCGTVSPGATPLISGGNLASRGEVPWHAGVYKKNNHEYTQMCGGSLVKHRVVLSAAHCFWNEHAGPKIATAYYAVAVGKLDRGWNSSMDESQQSEVQTIHIPDFYRGSETNFQADIAVVIVKNRFEYTKYIRPICVEFNYELQNKQLMPGKKGKVAGWGLTTGEDNAPSQSLRVIYLPVISTATCLDNVPKIFQEYITLDKVCAGYTNKGKAVCKGDSGGGLAFNGALYGEPARFYLRGIVSVAPPSDGDSGCNVNNYTAFTQLLSHETFIKQFWKVDGLACKEETLKGYIYTSMYTMQNKTFHHVTLERDFAGLSHFEMHIGVQAETAVVVLRKDVGWEHSQYTELFVGLARVTRIPSPNILSTHESRKFYIKIYDRKLEFGKEGDSSPIISFSSDGLRAVDHIGFANWAPSSANILYDCPAPDDEDP